jgi:hypothetical protein
VLGAWIVVLGALAPAAAAPLFRETANMEAPGYPEGSRTFTLDLDGLRAVLDSAPRESFTAPVPGQVLALPLPGGRSEEFTIWESPIMHPDLAAQYPEIRTFVGRGLDDRTATVRLDLTPAGFHALILSTRRTMLIDPIGRGPDAVHVSYFKRAAADLPLESHGGFTCELEASPEVVQELRQLQQGRTARSTGTELRTYRAAIAATGEYTQFHGGTVAAGLAAIVTSLNRVTGIYEREVAVRMELIPNNNLIVYTNPATDPYTNNSGGTMLGQNQSNLDSVIGNANYDIGHVFSTGGGGIAGLGVVCRTGNKARGVTGLNAPIGDIFDVDYVSHEMGHQYGGNHSFNGTAGSCGGGNRNGATAYEPGSGSTIMAYAGICGAHNIANSSDDYFHAISFDEITAYTQIGFGSNCPAVTPTGNNPPVPVAGNAGLTIPIETPFILYGSGSDPDGDEITYHWEEFDRGPAGSPDNPSGNAPIFRSWPPRSYTWRSFPRKNDVRNNTATFGEILPTYTRSLNFRFTVRDNLGGVDTELIRIEVDGNSGPFLVTSVDTTPWLAGSQRLVTWDVAGTDLAPVSCSDVNIWLSTDDGRTWTDPLALATPNDGSELVTVPAALTSEARVVVEGAGNVFFDMNDAPFVVEGGTGVEDLLASADALELSVRPNPFSARTTVTFAMTRSGTVRVRVFDAAGRRVASLVDGVRGPGVHRADWDGLDASGSPAASGVYFVRLDAPDQASTTRVIRLK